MYFYAVLAVHSALCVTLIGLVLLQQGKGADAGATFGGGTSASVFGAAGATDFITRLTTSLAIGFMVTSILLIRAYSTDGGRVLLSPSNPNPEVETSIMEQFVGTTDDSAAQDNSGVELKVVEDGSAAKEGSVAKEEEAEEHANSAENADTKESAPVAAAEKTAVPEDGGEEKVEAKDEVTQPES